MDYLLRKATADDAAGINELFIEMINTIYHTDDAKGYDAGYLDKFFVNGEDWICVAEKDSEIAAFLSIEVHREEGFIYLDDFSVTRNCRGLGIGTNLLGKAETYSEGIGIPTITLHVEKSNIDAYRLYQKLGYREYKDEGNRVLMMKKTGAKENMELIQIELEDAERIAPLTAAFRVQLKSYKGIQSQPDVQAAKEEIVEFINAGFPVYAIKNDGDYVGYIVCRIDEPCLWVEHIFVQENVRRKGVASMLFRKAEEIAASMGEDTVYNFVHPNNEGMFQFLRSKGYTVLNMIEVRKPYKGEKLTTTIHVEKEAFDY